jgi:hypothetical protein
MKIASFSRIVALLYFCSPFCDAQLNTVDSIIIRNQTEQSPLPNYFDLNITLSPRCEVGRTGGQCEHCCDAKHAILDESTERNLECLHEDSEIRTYSQQGQCIQCPSRLWLLGRSMLMFVLPIFLAACTRIGIEAGRGFGPLLITMDFLQSSAILGLISEPSNQVLTVLYDAVSLLTIGVSNLEFQCYLRFSKQNQIYTLLGVTCIACILSLVYYLVATTCRKLKRKEEQRNDIRRNDSSHSSFVVTLLYFVAFRWSFEALRLFACSLTPTTTKDSFTCSMFEQTEARAATTMLVVGMVGFAIFAVLSPLYIFLILKKSENQLNKMKAQRDAQGFHTSSAFDESVRALRGEHRWLRGAYKSHRVVWVVVVMLRKVILLAILMLPIPKTVQMIVCFCVLGLSTTVQIILRPFMPVVEKRASGEEEKTNNCCKAFAVFHRALRNYNLMEVLLQACVLVAAVTIFLPYTGQVDISQDMQSIIILAAIAFGAFLGGLLCLIEICLAFQHAPRQRNGNGPWLPRGVQASIFGLFRRSRAFSRAQTSNGDFDLSDDSVDNKVKNKPLFFRSMSRSMTLSDLLEDDDASYPEYPLTKDNSTKGRFLNWSTRLIRLKLRKSETSLSNSNPKDLLSCKESFLQWSTRFVQRDLKRTSSFFGVEALSTGQQEDSPLTVQVTMPMEQTDLGNSDEIENDL